MQLVRNLVTTLPLPAPSLSLKFELPWSAGRRSEMLATDRCNTVALVHARTSQPTLMHSISITTGLGSRARQVALPARRASQAVDGAAAARYSAWARRSLSRLTLPKRGQSLIGPFQTLASVGG
jgi:hypothetical protein